MSAFVVNKTHIDMMVQLALEGPTGRGGMAGSGWGVFYWFHGGKSLPLQPELADATGLMLVSENVTSVKARYQDSREDNLPGPCVPYWSDYKWNGSRQRLSPVEGLSLLSCFEYQSCENEGWEASEAKAFCDALQHRLIGCLPGYSDAPWHYTAEAV